MSAVLPAHLSRDHTDDLTALAWVQDELRRTLEQAHKSMRRHLKETDALGELAPDDADPALLRQALLQLHQGVGALELVGLPTAASLLRACEQSFAQLARRRKLDTAAVDTLEAASFALLDYLQRLLGGKPVSPLMMFPQYRAVQALAGADRVHPADLWPVEWRWRELPADPAAAPRPLDADARTAVETQTLALMRRPDGPGAGVLSDLFAGLGAGARHLHAATLWKLAAAFFEAQAQHRLPADVHTKRMAARLLAQLRLGEREPQALADAETTRRLAHDLLFFCAQSLAGADAATAPRLAAVRAAWSLPVEPAVDYEQSRLGRHDPAWIVQARKRVAAAREAWSAVAGGELHRLPHLAELFQLVGDSLRRLYPSGERLAAALQDAVGQTVDAGGAPSPGLAMEVATSVLYLDASLDDAAFDQPDEAERVQRLAQRIDAAREGGAAQPLAPWMEALYRRVADRQTMGSVVQELRQSLGDAEKQIDQYFRQPGQRELLVPVPAQLQSMRGVLSVLGLDQGSHAVLRMRDDVDALLHAPADAAPDTRAFERLATNLGMLGFLIDMLNVQPQVAKSLFRFDAASGLLQSGVGSGAAHRLQAPVPEPAAAPSPVEATVAAPVIEDALPPVAAPDAGPVLLGPVEPPAPIAPAEPSVAPEPPAAALPEVHEPATLPPADDDGDDELRAIFIEEARDVLHGAADALEQLDDERDDLGRLTVLRRAFHTLKGSGRMVGLAEFGDAGWAAEQLYNARLASDSHADDALLSVTADLLAYLGDWVEAIAARRDGGHAAAPVQQVADALRLEGRARPLRLPGLAAATTDSLLDALSGPVPMIDAGAMSELGALEAVLTEPVRRAPPPPPAPPAAPVAALLDAVPDLPSAADLDFDFDTAPPTEATLPMPGRADPFELQPLMTSPMPLLPETGGPAADDAPMVLDFEFSLDDDAPVPPAPVEPDLLLDFDAPDASAPAVKRIGTLEVPLPLFDIYIAEADEQSRRLVAALADWQHEWHRPVGEEAVALAHSLAGNSATVGFAALSQLARQLEHTLAQAQALGLVDPGTLQLCVDAGEALRSLLHRFAAGLLGDAPPALLQALHDAELQLAEAAATPSVRGTLPGAAAPAPEPVATLDIEPTMPVWRDAPGDEPGALEGLSLPARDDELLVETTHGGLAWQADRPDDAAPAGSADTGDAHDDEPLPVGEVSTPWPVPSVFGELQPPQIQPLPEAPAPAVPAAADALDAEEGIDAVDAVDAELFPIFDEEAQELLPQLAGRLREWALRPDDAGAAAACMRTLHTLKGGARLAGAMRLGEMAHRLETAIEHLLARGDATAAEVELLEMRVDALNAGLEALQQARVPVAWDEGVAVFEPPPLVEPGPPAEAWPPAVDEAPWPEPAAPVEAPWAAPLPVDPLDAAPTPPGAEPLSEPLSEPISEPVPEPTPEHGAWSPPPEAVALPPIDWSRFAAPAPDAATAARPSPAVAAQAPVRVRAPLLDRLVNHAGEVSITRSRIDADVGAMKGSLADLTDNLERLRRQLRDLELQAESQIASRMEAAKAASEAFDPLELDRFTRFQELTRMMAESVNDVATVQRSLQRSLQSAEDELAAQARLTRGLQDDLLRTRMVEFESIADRLYRVVRQASKETGKPVRLDIVGGAIEVDRGVLDRMTGAFEHLLRNGVVHGIEPAELRAQRGKPASGTITVAVTHAGNEVGVEVRDDGGGLDLAGLRQRGVELGLLPADAPATDADVAQLVFAPGLTTAREVTELAGRGVGMDVVRSEVVAMGGRIETATTWGEGTSFRLVLPLTTAVTQVVLLRAGGHTVAVPSPLVEAVRRVPAAELAEAYAGGHVVDGGQSLPFFWLGALLQDSPRGTDAARSQPLVVIRSAQQRVALHVDEVLGNQEAVVKHLGAQLSRLPGLVGVTLLASGAPTLIYNPVALAALYGDGAQQAMRDAAAGAPAATDAAPAPRPPQAPLVLVVDDSLTVRRVTQRLLQREGYRVELAKDGLDALEKLAQERPAVLLSDIEMPRMDGFDLVRNLRGDPQLRELPVVMITSRIAQKHRDLAAELGVDHYLGKPYSEEQLLGIVARYTGVSASAASSAA